jgi:Bacterial PH domain
VDAFPLELEYRLIFGDRVLWWGRPLRLAIAGWRDLALLPVIGIAAATAAVVAFAPGPNWHPVVTAIFRLAFAGSGVTLIGTYLTIVVRQRRRRFYAITRDRVLLGDDFWSGGFRAVPLERITGATIDVAPSGEGTITLIVDDGTRPRLAHVPEAHGVRTTLMDARAAFLRTITGSGDEATP